MSAPDVSVVIPARNAASTIEDTLQGLAIQHFGGSFEVIVVDDGSTDTTARAARTSAIVDRVLVLNGVGPGRARNAGAECAAAALIAFLDSDCRPTPGWLAAGCAALQAADLVMGQTLPRPDQALGAFDRTLRVTGCSPLFESANLFVRRDLFERVGGFESWLGPRNGKELGEDVLFGWRARRSGARIAASAEALAHHHVFPRGPVGFAAERWRLRYFPALARRVPELRTAMFYRRYFLSARAARFDAAIVALLLALTSRRLIITGAAVPYGRIVCNDLHESNGVTKAGARVVADTTGFVAMLWGSARYRSLLI